jgi:hypothetical protein
MRPDPTDTAAAKDLCFRLMRADTEAEVVGALSEAGYWDDLAAWRLFSDNDNAFAVIGNQQAEAVAAFVEKIVYRSVSYFAAPAPQRTLEQLATEIGGGRVQVLGLPTEGTR